jgi:hypothetical protein
MFVSTWPNPQHPEWKEFYSAEGRFTATMPADPKTNLIATDTVGGKLLTHTVSSTDGDLNEYLISWTEYPEESIEHNATENRFNKVRDALVDYKGGRVLSESAIDQGGHPARDITFATSEGRVVRVRFYFAKNRFYQVMAEAKAKDSEPVKEFFNSFKLLPGKSL